MGRTKIEWCARPGTIPVSWSPVTGCAPISEGCKHCYAERMARRLAGRYGYPETPHHFDVTLRPDRLEQPLRWKKPRTVFACSMSDLFHKNVPDIFIKQDIWNIMVDCPQHTFLLLTKRPKRMLELLGNHTPWPKNIWVGITVENQAAANRRIPPLLEMPAIVRFVSCEPLLESLWIKPLWLEPAFVCSKCGWKLITRLGDENAPRVHRCGPRYVSICPGLNWVIIGGETGPGARPMKALWVREIIEQCKVARVAVFVKQLGSHVARSSSLITDSKGGNPDEWLADLRVRGWPNASKPS